MNYEVINTKTGKSVGVYEREWEARRYTGSMYRIVQTKKPANAFVSRIGL